MRLGVSSDTQPANIRMIHRRSTPRPWESEPSEMGLNGVQSAEQMNPLDRLDHIGDGLWIIGFSERS